MMKSECLYLTTDLGIFRCLFGFFLGVIAQRWGQRQEILASVSSNPVQILSLIFVGVILVYSRHEPWLAFLAPLAFFMLILSVSADTGWVAKFFGHRLPAYLGRISYSIYLMHAPTLLAFGFVIRAARGPAQFFLAAGTFVAAVILVSHLTFRYIEDPFRVRANALADRLFLRRSTDNHGQA
jgi:peptidoglycan/LPS O-acetylase OafA/YrhL